MANNALARIIQDAANVRDGQDGAVAHLLKRGVPLLAKSMLPGYAHPLVDGVAALVDGMQQAEQTAASYATPGFQKFTKWLDDDYRYGLIVIIGGGGGGKTATLCAISERIKATCSRMFFVGASARTLADTPFEPFPWKTGGRRESKAQRDEREKRNADLLERLPKRSLLLIPDAGLFLDSRTRGDDAEDALGELAQVARHLKVRILIDAQFSRLLSIRTFSGSCQALLYKPLGVTGNLIERDEMRPLSRVSEAAFNAMPLDQRKRHVYVFGNGCDWSGMVPVRLPSWYSSAISESHSEDNANRGSIDDLLHEDVVEGEFREVE